MVPKISPHALKLENFYCICVCRAPESDLLRNSLSAKWNGCIYVVEDAAVLDAAIDVVTSRKVRDKIKLGENVEQLVGEKINEYVIFHKIGAKVSF
jgi:nicotinic acid mononucleotide adenylyltransferase